jgi:CRP-like cAMP-binding protein
VARSRSISRFPTQEPTPANPRARNRLLQALPKADFAALRRHLQPVELVKEAVLIEAGAPLTHLYLPESGIISMMVRLSEGQTIELAMTGRDSILAASAAFGDAISLSEAVVHQSGSAVVLDLASCRAAADFAPCSRGMSRPCWRKPGNRLPAMRRTRSRRACRAGCCVRASYATAKPCR